MKTNRKLTQQEIKRKEEIDHLSHSLVQQGYIKSEYNFDLNNNGIKLILLTMPYIICISFIYCLCVNSSSRFSLGFNDILFLIMGTVLCLIVHECIHALFFALFNQFHFKSISFGIIWPNALYCTCKQPLTKKQYMIVILMPTLLLVSLLLLLSLVYEEFWLFLLTCLMLNGGSADILIFRKLRNLKSHSSEVLFLDHPCDIGFITFEK